MKQNKEDKKDPWPSIVGYSFIFLVVVGTIAGFFNVGSFGAILGIVIAGFITFIIAAMVLSSMNSEDNESSTIIKALIITIFIILGLLCMMFYK